MSTANPPPRPMPFAVMRNSHEAIRGGVKDCDQALAAGDIDAFQGHFNATVRGIATHGRLEDNGFFRLIDENFDNEATKNGLSKLHEDEAPVEKAVLDALAEKDSIKIAEAYEAWKEHTVKHLKLEEDVMMPKMMQIAKKVKGDPQRMAELFNEKILGPNFVDEEEMKFFVTWNATNLAKHGSQGQDGFTAMRVWVWGFQWSCTPDQWAVVLPSLKEALTASYPDYYSKLVSDFDIESPGKVVVAAVS